MGCSKRNGVSHGLADECFGCEHLAVAILALWELGMEVTTFGMQKCA